MRLLAQNPLRYRRQILALKHFFAEPQVHGAAARRPDLRGGRPAAAQHRPRRRLWSSWRSSTAPSGGGCASSRCAASHSAAATTTSSIEHGGLASSPAWSPPSTTRQFDRRVHLRAGSPSSTPCSAAASSRGTNALLIGAPGVGKSTLALTLRGGGRRARASTAVLFAFDEGLGDALTRAPSARHGRCGRISTPGGSIDPADRPGGAVAGRVRGDTSATPSRTTNARVVVIDSLNGYLQRHAGRAVLICRCTSC